MNDTRLTEIRTEIGKLPLKAQLNFVGDLISCVKGDVESEMESIREGTPKYERMEAICEALEHSESYAGDALMAVDAD